MATKRLVPINESEGTGKVLFADGERQLPFWERKYLDDALVRAVTTEVMGEPKMLIQLTYQQWSKTVYNTMEMRNHFTHEVERQMASHFRALSQ